MEFITITLPIMLTMVGGVYLIKSDHNKFEVRMEKIDARWAELFKQLHIIDKDVAVLKDKK